MPQVFQVLKCYKCLVFQVHQMKKSNKWDCKMCGEKQSVKRHYGVGSAKDCRVHVQKLNGIRGEVAELKQFEISTDDEVENVQPKETQLKEKSRWSSYVEDVVSPSIDNNSSMYLNHTEVVLELPQKRKRMFDNRYKNKIIKSQMVNEDIDDVSLSNIREDSLGYINQKSEIKLNNGKNINIKSKPSNENIDSINESDKYDKYLSNYKPETFIEFPHSSIKKEGNRLEASRQIVKKFKPPPINKNSKWAQFADEDEEEEPPEKVENPCEEQLCEGAAIYDKVGEEIENCLPLCTKKSQNNFNNLFSLCDDEDLDKVLDF